MLLNNPLWLLALSNSDKKFSAGIVGVAAAITSTALLCANIATADDLQLDEIFNSIVDTRLTEDDTSAASATVNANVIANASTATLSPAATLYPTATYSDPGYDPEKELVEALDDFLQGDIDLAFTKSERIIQREPTFRLAQLMYADLLQVKAGRPPAILDFHSKNKKQTLALLDEARIRWNSHNSQPEVSLIPQHLVQMPSSQKYAVLVDLTSSRLYIAENENGIGRIVKSFYASIGKSGAHKRVEGDGKTPVGVYRVTNWLDPKTLPDLYGDGAFPLNYPNAWDKKHKRTGSGIWLHGVPSNTYSRPPRSSRGCVALTNKNFNQIKPYVQPGQTTVILADQIDWHTENEARSQQAGLSAAIERWRSDWQSKNTDAYLSHYADSFTVGNMGRTAFGEHKRRVNAGKEWISIRLSDIGIMRYPAEPIFVATFEQEYKSNNFSNTKRKEQYWQRNSRGQWQILSEKTIN